MEQIFITAKDFMEMAAEFTEQGMDYVMVTWSKTGEGKNQVAFSASSDEIDYSIDYEFEEK